MQKSRYKIQNTKVKIQATNIQTTTLTPLSPHAGRAGDVVVAAKVSFMIQHLHWTFQWTTGFLPSDGLVDSPAGLCWGPGEAFHCSSSHRGPPGWVGGGLEIDHQVLGTI